MSQLQGILDQLTDERLESLVQKDKFGELNFGPAVETLRSLVRIGHAFDAQPAEELPTQVVSNAVTYYSQLADIANQIEKVAVSDPNLSNTRQNLIAQTENVRDAIATAIRPHIRASEISSERSSAELKRLLDGAADLQRQAREILAQAQQASGTVGAGQLSGYYEAEATNHGKTAKGWLTAAVVASLVLIFMAVVLLVTISVPKDGTGNHQWLEYARDLVTRLVVLSFLSYAVAFCVRGYRANTHLRIMNQQKRNALDTYRLFADSMRDDPARDVVTAAVVQTVFTPSETGYLEPVGEKTVLESQGNLLAALISRPK